MRSISDTGVEFLDPNQDEKDRKISKTAIRSSLERRRGQAFETLAHIGYLRSHISMVGPQERAVAFLRSKEGRDTVLLDLGGRYELRFRIHGATVVLDRSKYNVVEDGP